VEVQWVEAGPLLTNTYVVCDLDECVVVDPAGGVREVLRLVGKRAVVAVVATHLHFDHVLSAAEVVEAVNAPFHAHYDDWRIYRELNSVAVEWGFEVPVLPAPRPLGERLWKLEVIHTPGHTPGSVSLLGDGFVLTGDTLFKGTVGRTDLPFGDWRLLVKSVCKLYQLPGGYRVYPGHGPATYLGEEALYNVVNRSVCESGVYRIT